jgi:hypothetical protein
MAFLITQVAIFLERLVDDVTEPVRDNFRHNRRAVQNRIEYDAGRRTAERMLAGCHLIEHDAEREKVRTAIELLAADLFW